MAPKKIINIVEHNEFFPDFDFITLHWILSLDTIGVLKFLAYHRLIKNEIKCESCDNLMGLNKKKEDYVWICSGCRKMKSVRDKSFFAQSRLPISKLLATLYMWLEDFRNKNVVKELKLHKNTVVNWFNYCRLECARSKEKLGGPQKIIEIDETCWVKQKHNRGKPKEGTQIWYFGIIERGEGGQAIVSRVQDRKQSTLFKLIKKWIKPKTVIISDEWPAYLQMEKKLPQYNHMLIRHKKKTGGGLTQKKYFFSHMLIRHKKKTGGGLTQTTSVFCI